MEWITAWLDGIPDTWLRDGALAGLIIGFTALGMGAYQMITGSSANRRLKEMELRQKASKRDLKEVGQFLFQKFGERIEIRGNFEAPAAEMTASGGFRRTKKPSFLCRQQVDLSGFRSTSYVRFCCCGWPCGEVVRRGAAVHLSTGRRPVASKRLTRPAGLGFRWARRWRCSGRGIGARGRGRGFRLDTRGPGPWP